MSHSNQDQKNSFGSGFTDHEALTSVKISNKNSSTKILNHFLSAPFVNILTIGVCVKSSGILI